jgi:hypothetical protein
MTIHCLEFRRLRTIAPTAESVEESDHRAECGACDAFARSMLQFDGKIEAALNIPAPETLAARVLFRHNMAQSQDAEFEDAVAQALRVDVPEGLADRILARNTAEQAENVTPLRRPARTVVRLAIAASIALTVALGAITAISPGEPDNTLVNEAIAHVQHERWMYDNDQPIGMDGVRPVLQMVGMDVSELPGTVTHIYPCPWKDKRNFHLVMAGSHGKVSVMVMPGEHIDELQTSSDRSYAGIAMPIRHGSLAIVGHPDENLRIHADRVRQVLRWRM